MILGLGVDLVETERIRRALERFGSRFTARVLHPDEVLRLPEERVSYVAARFAAKEAAMKALGTGWRGRIAFQDIAVLPDPQGKPLLFLHHAARNRAEEMGVRRAHVSLTHEKSMAAAVVLLEA